MEVIVKMPLPVMQACFLHQISGKFCIYSDGDPPYDMEEFSLSGGWKIALDSTYAITPVFADGRRIGWLLGEVVDLENGNVIDGQFKLSQGHDSASIWGEICARCAGSWLFIADCQNSIEIRPDAAATLGIIYDPVSRRAASHAALILGDDYQARINNQARKTNSVDHDGWMTAGLTAHRGLYRLLPNHRLSFADFQSRRLDLQMPQYSDDAASVIDKIAGEIATTSCAFNRARRTAITLTGGFETRTILASLKHVASGHSFVTLKLPGNRLDAYLARQLAKTADLDHSILPARRASLDRRHAWLMGAGHALAGANSTLFPTVGGLDGAILIGGLGGEVGRGFLWPEMLGANAPTGTLEIIDRLKLPRSGENIRAVDAWRCNLPPDLDAFQILDLAYLELRLGPWAFGQPQMRPGPRNIHPLISYNQFRRMWALPPELRANNSWMLKLIQSQWDGLSQIPFNRYNDPRDWLLSLERAARNPYRAFAKARQILRSHIR